MAMEEQLQRWGQWLQVELSKVLQNITIGRMGEITIAASLLKQFKYDFFFFFLVWSVYNHSANLVVH